MGGVGTSRRRLVGYLAAWSGATVLAITAGLVAVNAVGDTLRDRGVLGGDILPDVREGGPPTPDPNATVRRARITEEFGAFVVECQGAYAVAVEALPDEDAGWRTVSYEPGPDDDVDAVFSNGSRSIDLEVYCNRGEPTVAEIERNTLPSD